MIEHRNSGFVTTNGLVPVNTICDKIGKGKTMDTLLKMFPKLNTEDVFEAIHFYAFFSFSRSRCLYLFKTSQSYWKNCQMQLMLIAH